VKLSLLSVGVVFTILMGLIRFDYNDPWLLKKMGAERQGDTIEYESIIDYVRGNYTDADNLKKPFTFRPLTIYMAAPLPFSPLTSLNIINLFFLSTAAVIFFLMVYRLTGNNKLALFAAILHGISFPLIFYGTIGLVDPGIIFFLSLGVYLIILKKYQWILLLIIPATLAKETIVLIIPFLFLVMHSDKEVNNKGKIILTILVSCLYLAIIYIIRQNAPGYMPDQPWNKWIPSKEVFIYNISRMNTWASLIMAVGIPGYITIWKIIKEKRNITRFDFAFIFGFCSGMFVFFYSILAAYADARHIWLTLPFSIPIAILYLDMRLKKNKLWQKVIYS
jgi:hypothetical protein